MQPPAFTRRATLAFLGSATFAPAVLGAPSINGRPRYHIAPPPGAWMNDPQRPVKVGGVWNLWALYNPTFPKDGTSWRRWTSSNLVDWTDKGVSIARQTTPYGDLWTGSTVIDTRDTAGFGAGALIALVTMPAPDAGGQNQSCALWYSRDGGATFTFHAIVLSGVPAHRDFRDPSVFWHEPTRNWVLTISEEGQIGFYSSTNLRNWKRLSAFARSEVGGVMECSQFFKLHLHDADGSIRADKWVLLVGGNGGKLGQTIGTYYWVGDFDGTLFTPTSNDGQWLDHGADFYATVVWTDPDAADPHASAYAIGWMQNWNYAAKFPAAHGYIGQLSIVRRLKLRSVENRLRLFSEPLEEQDAVFDAHANGSDQVIGDAQPYRWPNWPGSPACRIDFELTRIGAEWPRSVRLAVRKDGRYATEAVFDLAKSSVSLQRGDSGPKPTESPDWTAARVVPCDFSGGTAKVSLFVDASSVELFLNDGAATASSLIAAPLSAVGIALTATGGRVRVSRAKIASVSEGRASAR